MKKLLSIIAIAFVAFAMASCSTESPSKVAEKSVKCLQEKDYAGYVELLYFPDSLSGDKLKETKQTYQSLVQKGAQTMENKGGIKSYVLKSEEISDSTNTAKVVYNVTYGNDSEEEEVVKLRKDKAGDWKIDAGK